MTDLIDDMLTADELRKVIGGRDTPISVPTLYRWIRTGKIPRPLKLSNKMTRWRKTDIEVALQKLVEEDRSEKYGVARRT